MTPKEIGRRLTEIHATIVDRFDAQPFVEPSVSIHTSGRVSLNIYRDYNSGNYSLKTISHDTIEGALDEADAFLATLPPINEIRRREFLESLAKLIETGREIGIETDIINPLEATMNRLASNAITAA